MSGFGNLSSFNGLGSMAGTMGDPFGAMDGAHAEPVEYGGSPTLTSWYSYQAGLAGYGADPYFGRAETSQEREIRQAEEFQEQELERARADESQQEHTERVRQIRLGKSGRKREKESKAYRIVQLDDGAKVKQTGTNKYQVLSAPKKTAFYKLRGKWIKSSHPRYGEVSGAVLACCGPFSPGATASDWMRLTAVGAQTGLSLAKAFGGLRPQLLLGSRPSTYSSVAA